MRIRSNVRLIVLLAIALVALGYFGWRRAVAAERQRRTESALEQRARERQLRSELDSRVAPIAAEIELLGPEHPWAGRYHTGDGMGWNLTIWVAPRSGCAVMLYGCLGLNGANWGRVQRTGSTLEISFERPNAPGKSGNFYDRFTMVEDGGKHSLVAPENPVFWTLVR